MNEERLNEIIQWGKKTSDTDAHIEFSEEIFHELDEDSSEVVKNALTGSTLMKLPQKEIKFFEWLKEKEPTVWKDLWEEDDIAEKYVVSIDFLPLLIYANKRDYPICDLEKAENFYFTEMHMTDEESKVIIEVAYKRLKDKKDLSVPQLLALEIKTKPTDIWHFAYKYNLKVGDAKRAVRELVEDDALVHLKDAEYLAPFVDF